MDCSSDSLWVVSPDLRMVCEFSRHSRETWSEHSGVGDELRVMARCLPLQRHSSLVPCLDYFLDKWANFRARLKAKVQGAEAIPERKQIHPNPSEKQGSSWLQGISPAKGLKLFVLWVVFGQQTPQETLTGSLASTSSTLALSHLAQQKLRGHLKQKSL